MIKFEISSVDVCPVQIGLQHSIKEAVACANGEVIPEAESDGPKLSSKNYTTNRFVGAVHRAYSDHYPLVISPDDIWLCIAQGFAKHITKNAEKYRNRFVQHEGKEVIRIEKDTFIKGDPKNAWQGVFTEFSDRVAKYIGKTRDLIVADFSTTGPVEKAASQVVLLDAMQQYFDYRVCTRCGIPSIQLMGTIEDWRSVRTRAGVLREYDLGWWIDTLEPVLDQFIEACSGRVDKSFWSSLYKTVNQGSGGPSVSGWIGALFPYIVKYDNTLVQNYCMEGAKSSFCLSTSVFPGSLSKAPFIWEYYGEEIHMDFIAGHVGYTQQEDGALKSVIGWAISENKTIKVDPDEVVKKVSELEKMASRRS